MTRPSRFIVGRWRYSKPNLVWIIQTLSR
jgi:hypothetical protein